LKKTFCYFDRLNLTVPTFLDKMPTLNIEYNQDVTRGTDIKSEIILQKRDIIETLNKFGLYGVLIFSLLSFLFTCIWFGMCDILDLKWGSFGIHILMMSGAFLLVGPMAAITYRLLVDQFGVSRKIAMMVHGYLQLASTILGTVGVRAVWIVHERTYHFKTSHSIMGIFGLSVYFAQLLAATYVYTVGSKAMAASFRHLHRAVGQGLVVVMMYIAALGMMYFESQAMKKGWDNYGSNGYYRPFMTVAQYCIVFLMLSTILVYYSEILV